jgi:glucan phosphoethanolaminetransferase (alkaline phosphatase superfamily)
MSNWSYDSSEWGIQSSILKGIFGALSFSTVIPAVFETSDLLKAFHLVHKKEKKHRKNVHGLMYLFAFIALIFLIPLILLPQYRLVFLALIAVSVLLAVLSHFYFIFYILIVLGVIFTALSVLWPVQFSYLIWLGLWFILDPVNHFFKEPSLLGMIKSGKWKVPLAYFFAGYICGFFWEFWNKWAIIKWNYSLPLLNEIQKIKLFEMPVLGYIPYGFFAFELFALYYFTRTLWKIERIEVKKIKGKK